MKLVEVNPQGDGVFRGGDVPLPLWVEVRNGRYTGTIVLTRERPRARSGARMIKVDITVLIDAFNERERGGSP